MATTEPFEAARCGVSIDHGVQTRDCVESVDAGSHVTLEFTAAGGDTLTVGMSREAFNRFLLEHLHLAEANLNQAPDVIVGRSGQVGG